MSINKVFAIVDDESSFRLRFRLVLQKVGISIQSFLDFDNSDGLIEAYQKDSKPFAVFIDINLKSGGMFANGLDLVKEIRAKYNGISIIAVVSTSNRKEEIDKARLNGANCYIVKSGSLDIFSKRMTEFKNLYLDGNEKSFKVFGDVV